MDEIKKKSIKKYIRLFFLLSIATFFFNGVRITLANELPVVKQPVNPPIKVGMSVELTGFNATIGIAMKEGIQTYFNKINSAGGIDGRKLDLIALDDAYVPIRAAENVRNLIEKENVIAILGNTGTPTAVIVLPIITQLKTLLFAPHTGGIFLEKNPYVLNFRANYADEVTTMIKGLLSAGIKPDEIAFFSQSDAFGDSIYQSGMRALKASGYANPETLPYGRYDRDSLNVLGALVQIVNEAKIPPKAIILGGVSVPNIKFIKLAEQEFPNTVFLIVSGLININDLSKEENQKVIVTQVVPYLNSSLPAIQEYLNDLKTYGGNAQPSYSSLEGYLAAKLFVIGLKQASLQHKLTRAGLIDTFENMHNIDIGIGIPITFTKTDRTAIHKVWLTIYKNGQLVPMQDWKDIWKNPAHVEMKMSLLYAR